MTHDEKIAHMANGIAGFFRSYPEEQAVAGIRDHLVAFWPRRMQDDLRVALGGEIGARVDPLVARALKGISPRTCRTGA